MNPAEIHSQLIITEDIASSAITADEGIFLYGLIRQNGFNRTIETGLGPGASAVYIMSAASGTHIAIDPHQEGYGNLGLKNVEKFGYADRLVFENDYSYFVLPRLAKSGAAVDFAFIDGGHTFDQIFIDFTYTDLMLEPGGMIVFHDKGLRATRYVLSWIMTNKTNYKIVRTPFSNLALVQKLGLENRTVWWHFEYFGELVRWQEWFNNSYRLLQRGKKLFKRMK